MWLVTQYGFFSVVKDQYEEKYKIRSRAKKDLLNLFPEDRIITTYDSDYRHRVIVAKAELDEMMAKCADINYFNFKDHIAGLPDQKDKKSYYGEIWRVMFGYQNKLNE